MYPDVYPADEVSARQIEFLYFIIYTNIEFLLDKFNVTDNLCLP